MGIDDASATDTSLWKLNHPYFNELLIFYLTKVILISVYLIASRTAKRCSPEIPPAVTHTAGQICHLLSGII